MIYHTSLVPFAELRKKQPTTHPHYYPRLDFTSVHAQTLKWVWQQSIKGKMLASNTC